MIDLLAQHEARIIAYAARIARGERLFEPTPEKMPEADRPGVRMCIGCGRLAMQGWGAGIRPAGWVVQLLPGQKKCGVEIHCPDCVRAWGLGMMGTTTTPRE